MPISISVLALALWLFIFKHESFDFLLKHESQSNNHNSLYIMFQKVYKVKDKNIAEEIIERSAESLSTSQKVPNTFDVMFDPKYRAATWVCIVMALIN